MLIGKTDAEAEAPVFWSSDANNWHIGKVPDAGKDWGQKEKKLSEGEMAGWHHRAVDMNLDILWEMVRAERPGVLQSMGLQSRTRLGDWIMTTMCPAHY